MSLDKLVKSTKEHEERLIA